MKSFFGKLAAFFRKTWVWSLCLVLVLALLVWFVGPLLAVNDYKFWESATSRLLSISGLFLIWGLAMVFASWKATARKKAEEDDADAQERLRREGLINEEQLELRNRFKQALHTLKRSSLYRGRSEKWRNELPWYLLLGPQSSGKTSLLDFLRKRRARPLNGVLVNIPVEQLQGCSEIELENLARQTRQRLQDIHQRLGADVPL